MFCFRGTNERHKLERHVIIHNSFPSKPSNYLPKLSEHIVQNEPECVIDDPSSIFFDPNEKSGFVYTAIPKLQQQFTYDSQQYLKPIIDEKSKTIEQNRIDNKILTKVMGHHIKPVRESPLSSEFDDSLDRTQSLPNTPLRKTENMFIEQFDTELEFDPIGGIGESNFRHSSYNSNTSSQESRYNTNYNTAYNVTSNLKNKNTRNVSPGLSEEEVKKLYDNSHDELLNEYNDLHLYEEELFQHEENNRIYSHGNNKGYLSDAESVKTYQDSGIYDDDVFMESPKPLTSEEYAKVAHHLVFGNNDNPIKNENNNDELETERYSAFKTPMSSRQNSLESLDSIGSPYGIRPPEIKLQQERGHNINKNIPKNMDDNRTLQQAKQQLPIHHPQHPSNTKSSWKQTSNNKYSHIQAKVQSHRTRSERSPSPGVPLRKKSPPTQKPNWTNKSVTKPNTLLNPSVKSKVDSLSNIKYMPGGGETKVFKEKLSFRQKAEARTDTHGIGMYANLPEEFQEIARRLARQDSQLKKQEFQRGRSTSRSRTSSRHSSASPNTRGRSRTRRNKRITPGNSISDIYADVNLTKTPTGSPSRQTSLSRSSSIRSIPSTPHLSRLHPSTSLRQNTSKSPVISPKASPSRRLTQTNSTAKASNNSSIEEVKTSHLLSSPVSKLYQFTTENESFGSPQYTMNSIYQIAPAVR